LNQRAPVINKRYGSIYAHKIRIGDRSGSEFGPFNSGISEFAASAREEKALLCADDLVFYTFLRILHHI
jgi:hypothetical protein